MTTEVSARYVGMHRESSLLTVRRACRVHHALEDSHGLEHASRLMLRSGGIRSVDILQRLCPEPLAHRKGVLFSYWTRCVRYEQQHTSPAHVQTRTPPPEVLASTFRGTRHTGSTLNASSGRHSHAALTYLPPPTNLSPLSSRRAV